MSKILLFVALLLLSVTWVVAQDSTAGGQSSQSGSSSPQSDQSSSAQPSSGMSPGNETSIEGCLSGSAGSYTLTNSSGTAYQLSGSTDDLAKHVNQQVRVRGTQSASSASSNAGQGSQTNPSSASNPSSSSSASNPSSSSSSSQLSFTVSKVSKISDTCSASNR